MEVRSVRRGFHFISNQSKLLEGRHRNKSERGVGTMRIPCNTKSQGEKEHENGGGHFFFNAFLTGTAHLNKGLLTDIDVGQCNAYITSRLQSSLFQVLFVS